jgi:hypothetical protein
MSSLFETHNPAKGAIGKNYPTAFAEFAALCAQCDNRLSHYTKKVGENRLVPLTTFTTTSPSVTHILMRNGENPPTSPFRF